MLLLMCFMISILLNKIIKKIWLILSTNSMFCLLATSLGTFYVIVDLILTKKSYYTHINIYYK